jgi:cytochrome P450
MNTENINFGETSYLEQYDKASINKKFSLVRNWLDNSPLPFFEELRGERPILETEKGTLFAKFEDVVEILSLPSVFTVELYEPKMDGYLMAEDGTALHMREKSIMKTMLNRDDLPRVRSLIAEHSRKTLINSGHQIELVNNFCRTVPTHLVQKYFGLDGIAPEKLIEWSYWSQYDSFHNQPFDEVESSETIHANSTQARIEIRDYLAELIPRRFAEIKAGTASDDIVTRMLSTRYPDDVGFPLDRLGANIGGLLIGTVETTAQAVAQITQKILRHQDVLSHAKVAIQNNDNQAFDSIVWEALRFNPIAPYLFRISASDYTIARGTERETFIPQGTMVLPLILSAMFDPDRFPEPYKFDSQRPWYNTFHFGFGLHECLGKHIGMVMIPEMVKQILRLPGIHSDTAIDYKASPFPEFYQVSWDK